MLKLLFKGPVLTASGYGVHARQVLSALLKSNLFDVSVRPIRWGETSFINDESELIDTISKLSVKAEQERQAGSTYDLSVQVTIPNEFEKLAKVNIGITAGIETDHVSAQWLLKCNSTVDLLVVPSKHSYDSFVNTTYHGNDGSTLKLDVPIQVIHEGIDTTVFNTEACQPYDIELPAFTFIHVGLGLDKPLGEDRKNITHLVKWFCERFKGNKDVGLVLKTSLVNGSLIDQKMTVARVTELKRLAGCDKYPVIKLVHGRLSDRELASLYKHPNVKAFVSLTHGEGFGLPLLEAAACGLPVMATDWSGHLDFLRPQDEQLFVPVSMKLGKVPPSAVWKDVIEEDSCWAYPDENDFKTKAYKLTKSYETPKKWADRLAKLTAENFSTERVYNRLIEILSTVKDAPAVKNQTARSSQVAGLKKLFDRPTGQKTLLYTMPMSAGDVFISTAVVDSLKKKYPEHFFYFATDKKYFDILKGNKNVDQVIQFQDWMMDVPFCEDVFDWVYTPNTSLQLTVSNWVHKGRGRKLAEEMAHACDVELGEYFIETEIPERLSSNNTWWLLVHPGSSTGQWGARAYAHWQDVIDNLKRNLGPLGIGIAQIGAAEDVRYKNCVDLCGQTTYNQLAGAIESAICVVGIDSVSMHLAAALKTPHVALFGSSYPTATGPTNSKTKLSVLLETSDRHGCEKACYKNECAVDKDNPCINEIPASEVVKKVFEIVSIECPSEKNEKFSYVESLPKISGYTHILNPKEHGFPFIQSIKSMLGFCDEVVVVDGGSTDGSVEMIRALKDERVQVIERPWDWEEPGMDGQQKAFGRAMCAGDFLWQMDADEVVHEEDYTKIKKLVKNFPKDCDILHLPVIELWGDDHTVRTDRHSWKWRLTRNNFRITHGINKDARVVDPETGKTYAKRGQSDGCEYVDIMTGEFLPHTGYYTPELERLRVTDPVAYGNRMNQIFQTLPSVFHYSWADLPRKIRNFKKFWNRCWSNLYADPAPVDRFPDVETDQDIEEKAKQLLLQGGEHKNSVTFALERSVPEVMK